MPRLREFAFDALSGVGDPASGEWEEVGDIAFHLRRRLTEAEAEQGQIASVLDIRGTWEATKRLNRVRKYLPAPYNRLPDEALP